MRKKHCRKTLSVLLGTAGTVCILACIGGDLSLSADAASATLKAQDAVVYEQPDEESSPVGNLVEGSSFEYAGDVTAEDGTVWHQVATADGISGYIKGDLEMEIGEEEAFPEGQDISEADSGAEADNPSEESDIHSMQNNRTKSYVLDGSDKIKKKGNPAKEDGAASNPASANAAAGIDTTLLFSIAVVLFCSGAIYILCGKMTLMKRQAETDRNTSSGGATLPHRKNEKKKSSSRRKIRGNRKQR